MADPLGLDGGGILVPIDDEARRAITGFAPTQGIPQEETLFPDLPLAPINQEQLLPFENAITASDVNPDQAASDAALAERLLIAPGMISDLSRSEFERQDRQQKIEDGSEETELLRSLLRNDPDLTMFASDDIPSLARGEQAVKELSFTGAFSGGVDLLQGLGYRFLEAVGEAGGLEDLEAFAQAQAEREFAEAQAGGVKQHFLDIQDAGDFFTWLKQTGGEQIPLMAPSLVTGIAGAAIGSAVPVIGTVIGGLLGAFIPSFILGVGETQNAIKERDKNIEAPGAAFGAGAIIGLLDSALPGKVGTMLKNAFGRELAEVAVQKIAFRVMAKKAAAEGGKGMGMEGITEAVQEVISETTAASVTGQEIDGDALMRQVVEAFAAGAFLGGGVTVAASTSASIINNRRVKRAMDESSREEAAGKLKVRNATKAAEVKVAQMKAAGVESVFVPTNILLDYAQRQENPIAALENLGLAAALDVKALAELDVQAGTTKIEITLAAFAEHLHGTEAYAQIAPHLTVAADATSLAESLETAFTDEEDVVAYQEDLEAYDAADELKARVSETVNKAQVKPSEAHKIIEAAGREVEVVLDTLIQKLEERKGGFDKLTDAARVAAIDDELTLKDTQLVNAQDHLANQIRQGRALGQAKKNIAALIAEREKLIEEQANILSRRRVAAVEPASEEFLVDSTGVAAEGDALQAELASLQEQKARADASLQQAKDTGDTKRANQIKKKRTQLNKDIKAVEDQIAALEGRKPGPKTRKEALRDKALTFKGRVLDALGVKIKKENVRDARDAFKKGLAAGKTLIKAQQAIVKELQKLKTLTKDQKAQLAQLINKATTLKQLTTKVTNMEARTAEFVERNRRKQVVQALKDVLKKTRTTGGEKRIGKYTADVQRFFDDARVWLRIDKPLDARGRKKTKFRDQEALEIELIDLMTGTKEDPIPDPNTLVQRQLLAIGSGSKEFQVNTIDLENLLITINEMMEAERKANLDKINKARTHKNKDVKDGREFVTEGKPTAEMKGSGFWGILKRQSRDLRTSLSGWHNGWDELLDINFNKKGVDARRLIESLRLTKEIQKHKGRVLQWQEELLEIEKKIYGITGHADLMDKQRADNVETNFGVQQLAQTDEEAEVGDDGQRQRLEYSKSEIRKLWMEHQDPTLVETIESGYGMGFDQPILDMLFDTLSDKDKAFAQAQLDFYKRIYQPVNKVYRERYGVDLPFNEFYSPIQRDQTTSQEGGKDTFGTDLVFTDERTYRRTIPKGILTRVDNVIPLMKRSDVGAMHRYMHDMSWFIEASEKVLHIKSVFKDTKLEADIAAQHGKNMNGLIRGFLDDFGPGYAARGAAAEKIFGTINRQFAGSVLALKGTIGTKQLVSWFAMADNVPAKDFLKSHIDFFKVGKDGKTLRSQEIVKFLWENSAALRARGSSLDFELAKIGAINKPLFTGNAIKVKGRRVTPSMAQWEEWKFAIIKLGDRLPIYAGGWAFSTTQQSTDIDKLSSLQRAGPIGRTLTMFMTARMALLRGEIRAIRQVKRGKIGYREFGKRMAYYHLIMPMMIQYIASGFEWEDDRQFVAALLGQLNSLVIFGDILMVAAEDIFAEGGSQWQRGDELPVQSIFREIWAGVYDAIESGGDIEELLEAVGDITAAIGLVAGQPLDQIGNILGGVADVTEGDIEKGLKRIWGFSEKVAEESSK
jgi:hypothetical protein